MSGFTVELTIRRRCEASGKKYTRFLRRGIPDGNGILKCPACGKGVTLRPAGDGSPGVPVMIPRHLELIVGL